LNEHGYLHEDVEKLIQNLALMETPFYLFYKRQHEPTLIQILQINGVQSRNFTFYYLDVASQTKIAAHTVKTCALVLSEQLFSSLHHLNKFQDLVKKYSKEAEHVSSTSDCIMALSLFYIDNELKSTPQTAEISIGNDTLFAFLNTQESSRVRMKPEPAKLNEIVMTEQVPAKNLDTSMNASLDSSIMTKSTEEEERSVSDSKTEVQTESLGNVDDKGDKEEAKEDKENAGKEDANKPKNKRKKKKN